MAKLIGVVEKPQFDTEVFEQGKAVHVKQYALSNGFIFKDKDGLIGRVNPLEIVIWVYDKHVNDCESMEITIDSIISGEYKITLLEGGED